MPPSCALLGGFAIGARVALLWQHNANPSYKLASTPQYDDIVRTRNFSECSVLVLCLVTVCDYQWWSQDIFPKQKHLPRYRCQDTRRAKTLRIRLR